jgi:hypothetical protein
MQLLLQLFTACSILFDDLPTAYNVRIAKNHSHELNHNKKNLSIRNGRLNQPGDHSSKFFLI